jgi:hypothetical protein
MIFIASMAVYGTPEETSDTPVLSASVTDINTVTADPKGNAKGAEVTQYDKLVASNGRFEMYLDDMDFVVKIKDKSNRYVWSSAAAPDKMESLNFEWQRVATSFLTAEYINNAGAVSRSPLKHSNARAPEFTRTRDGFSARVEFYEAKIRLTVDVKLTEKGFTVSVLDKSIERIGENYLHKLYIMPFFGAALADEIPGYVMIPDGCGALIRFSKPTRQYLSSYSERVYGSDFGMKRPVSASFTGTQTDEMKLAMPLFGVAHGGRQNAFLAVANSGDAFMEIEVSPAGATTEFTWVSPKFIYRDQYLQPTSKTGSSFIALQQKDNSVNAQMEYIFLSGEDADYSGMAVAYREMLVSEGKLSKKTTGNASTGIRLEAVMAEVSKGLIGNTTEIMTHLADVKRWVGELKNAGVGNLSLVLYGFEKNGVHGHKLETKSIDSGVGKEKELAALHDLLDTSGGQLVLRKDIFKGYRNQVDRSRLAYHIDGGLIEKSEPKKPIFQEIVYSNMPAMKQQVEGFGKAAAYKRNIALSDVGESLFSDYKQGRVLERNQMQSEIVKLLEAAEKNTDRLALYSPNGYAFRFADAVYDIPMKNSQYVYETDTIPFIQMVLSGNVECFSPSLNFWTNTIEDTLKLIDFGVSPSYLLTQKPANRLADTNMNDIYSSRYEDYKPYIIRNYQMINNTLSKVSGTKIMKRVNPENGISIIQYEDGSSIIVNYTTKPFVYGKVTVNGQTAEIVKG